MCCRAAAAVYAADTLVYGRSETIFVSDHVFKELLLYLYVLVFVLSHMLKTAHAFFVCRRIVICKLSPVTVVYVSALVSG